MKSFSWDTMILLNAQIKSKYMKTNLPFLSIFTEAISVFPLFLVNYSFLYQCF